MNLTFTLPDNYLLLSKFEKQTSGIPDLPIFSKVEFGYFDEKLNTDWYFKWIVSSQNIECSPPTISHATSLVTLIDIFDIKNHIKGEIEERLRIAPNKLQLLEKIIHEINAEYSEPFEIVYVTYDISEPAPLPITAWNKEYLAFYAINNGYDATIQNFAHFILYTDNNDKIEFNPFFEDDLKDIAKGAAMAYVLPELEKQLAGMKKEGNTIEPETNAVNTKLKWLGTPAQFGFIIQELIGKDYLEKPTASFAKDAALYLQLFDIQTTPATLAKEISTGENQNSLSSTNRAKIKIAHKDQLK